MSIITIIRIITIFFTTNVLSPNQKLSRWNLSSCVRPRTARSHLHTTQYILDILDILHHSDTAQDSRGYREDVANTSYDTRTGKKYVILILRFLIFDQ